MSESIELYESMNREIQQLDEQIASLEESLRDFKLRRGMFAQAVEHFQNNQQMPHPMAPSEAQYRATLTDEGSPRATYRG